MGTDRFVLFSRTLCAPAPLRLNACKSRASSGSVHRPATNGHFRSALRFDHLVDVGFEQVICHTKAAVGIELLLRQEKAIRAIKSEHIIFRMYVTFFVPDN